MSLPTWSPRVTTTTHGPRDLLALCAGATLVATVAMQAVGRFVGFPSLVVIDLAMVAGSALLGSRARGGRRAGAAVIGVFSLLNNVHVGLFLSVLAAPAADPARFATCTVTWVASLVAIPVSVAVVRDPDGDGGRVTGAVRQGLLVVTVAAALVGGALLPAPAPDAGRPGDLEVTRERTGWGLFTDQAGRVMVPAELTAAPGPVAIVVRNTDPLVGATFRIDELDVHARVAPGGSTRVLIDAPAGRYRFHDDTFLAGGVLEVR